MAGKKKGPGPGGPGANMMPGEKPKISEDNENSCQIPFPV